MKALLADATLNDALAYLGTQVWCWQEVYASAMRASLFTGFLTLASFLMAVAAFVLVNVKTHVLDKPSYFAEWRKEHRAEDPKDVYRSLDWLAARFKRNIIYALIASVSQFSIGMIPHPLAMFWCLGIAVWAFIHLFGTICYFSSELKVMVTWLRYEGHPEASKRS